MRTETTPPARHYSRFALWRCTRSKGNTCRCGAKGKGLVAVVPDSGKLIIEVQCRNVWSRAERARRQAPHSLTKKGGRL
jgi:hypothetical protein